MKVVIVGKMGSGKTTVSDYLIMKHGYHKISLAAPLKMIELDMNAGATAAEAYWRWVGINLDPMKLAMLYQIFYEGQLIEREYPKPRKRLQFIGTTARQHIADNIWLLVADQWIKTHIEQTGDSKIVIDDVRFTNEYEHFFKQNWYPIKLSCPESIRLERLKTLYGEFDPANLTHASEIEIDGLLELPGGALIDNSMPMSELYNVLDEIIENKV